MVAVRNDQHQRHQHELQQIIGTPRQSTVNNQQQQQHQQQPAQTKQNIGGRRRTLKREIVSVDETMHVQTMGDLQTSDSVVVVEYDEDAGFSYSPTSVSGTSPLHISPEASLTVNSIQHPSELLDQQQLLNVRHVPQQQQQQQKSQQIQAQQVCEQDVASGLHTILIALPSSSVWPI